MHWFASRSVWAIISFVPEPHRSQRIHQRHQRSSSPTRIPASPAPPRWVGRHGVRFDGLGHAWRDASVPAGSAGWRPRSFLSALSSHRLHAGRATHDHACYIDRLQELAEADEVNNIYSRQFVWTPLARSPPTPLGAMHALKPKSGGFDGLNAAGLVQCGRLSGSRPQEAATGMLRWWSRLPSDKMSMYASTPPSSTAPSMDSPAMPDILPAAPGLVGRRLHQSQT